MQTPSPDLWHGTTILTVRKGDTVVIGGDGQVSIGQTVVKANAKKVRRLGKGDVIGGFAGATADAFTLFERLEAKLDQYPGQLTRAAVELAKDWRTDRYLLRLEAMMLVADAQDRKSTRLNSSHLGISYAVFCLKKKKKSSIEKTRRRAEGGGCDRKSRRG